MAIQFSSQRLRRFHSREKTKVINGYTFTLHLDNLDPRKRKANCNFDLYAFWGYPHGVTEDVIYWATKHIAIS